MKEVVNERELLDQGYQPMAWFARNLFPKATIRDVREFADLGMPAVFINRNRAIFDPQKTKPWFKAYVKKQMAESQAKYLDAKIERARIASRRPRLYETARMSDEEIRQRLPSVISDLKLQALPVPAPSRCVYFLCCNQIVVYVGKSTGLVNRIWTHVGENNKEFDSVFYFEVDPKHVLEIVEAAFIMALRPRYNSMQGLRGNKEIRDKMLHHYGALLKLPNETEVTKNEA